MTKEILRNRAKCKLCGDVIESTYVHDFVSCSCGEIFVDGGHEYARAGAKDFKNFIPMYVYEGETKDADNRSVDS